MPKKLPDLNYLKEILSYNKITGEFHWKVSVGSKKIGSIAGSQSNHKYMSIQINSKKYLLHRLAYLYVHGVEPIYDIDHINGIKCDNRICNLRDVPRFVNCQNNTFARTNNELGVRGVYFKKGLYNAQIKLKNKNKYLGCFKNIGDAENSYLEAKKKYHEGFVS